MFIYRLLETDIVPEPIIRFVVQRLLDQKLKLEKKKIADDELKQMMQMVAELKASPIAIETNSANQQHYELPTEFFKMVLGHNLKYSCALWQDDTTTLDKAEENMLALYCDRADIKDGHTILDLGCGWGSHCSIHGAKISQ